MINDIVLGYQYLLLLTTVCIERDVIPNAAVTGISMLNKVERLDFDLGIMDEK